MLHKLSVTYRLIVGFILFAVSFTTITAQGPSDFELLFRLRMQSIDPLLLIDYNPRIKDNIFYLSRQKAQQTEDEIADFIFYQSYIQHELMNRNLPVTLQYIPLALTGMQKHYEVDFHRAGAWSLPVFVAIRYGLIVNNDIDERMDVLKASKAAVAYLEDLFLLYNDLWDVLIAYAEGAPGLNAAKIRLHTDNTNPNELYASDFFTNNDFVVNYLSYAYLANYYDKHGFILKKQSTIKTQIVSIKNPVYIQHLKEKLQLTSDEFSDLNPIIVNKTCIPLGDICIPIEKAEMFICLEDSLYYLYEQEQLRLDSLAKEAEKKVEPEVKTITYIVKNGDYLGKIAKKHHVSVSQIMKWNHLKKDKINIGQRLIIYKD
ncbi:MAG: lytic transglycosylase [Bacteroidales bacterium]|nr:lytic transglycosylase [Bacteroidales bacterium]